jgi:hypothetical protein
MIRDMLPKFLEIAQRTANDARAKGAWEMGLKTLVVVAAVALVTYIVIKRV